MSTPLPTPLAAALGLVPAVLDGVLRLPGRAVRLPVQAVSSALATMDQFRRGYDDLADRGERLVARLRGQAVEAADEFEDSVEDVLARTPFATAYDKAEDALEDAAAATEQVVARISPLAGRARRDAPTAAPTASTAADTFSADVVDTGTSDAGTGSADTGSADAASAERDPEAPKGVPTPKAVGPDTTRVDTAASPSVVEAVEQAAAEVSTAPLEHDQLPLPDYDHMTLGSLRGRMRALSVEQLVQIRTYEKAHADRLPIVTMLDNRIAKLSTDAGATPSGPVSREPAPEQRAAAAAPAPAGVSPATTTAPVINPPSQGDPTNPAQPR